MLIFLQHLFLSVCSLIFGGVFGVLFFRLTDIMFFEFALYLHRGASFIVHLLSVYVVLSTLTLVFPFDLHCLPNSLVFKLLHAKHLAQCLVHNSKCSVSGSSDISWSIHFLTITATTISIAHMCTKHTHTCTLFPLQLHVFSQISSNTGPTFFGNWQSSYVFSPYFPIAFTLDGYSSLH